MSKAVSIVIPTYNRYSCLQKTLQSLNGQTFKDFEVIVSDDGSTDQTKTIAKKKYKFPLKLVSQVNSGRAAARNNGFQQAQGQIIIFIDDHIILDKNFVTEHYNTQQKFAKNGVGVVRGRVEYIQTPDKAPKNPPRLKKKPNKFNENSPFVNFITNNISVTREALELTGGFDPDFTEYGFQDQELGYRIRQRGIKYKVNVKAVGYIFSVSKMLGNQRTSRLRPSAPLSDLLEKRLDKFRQAGRSAVLFYRKHPWGGRQLGVNIFNIFLNVAFSLNNDWLIRIYRKKLAKVHEKSDVDYYVHKIHRLLFLKGINDGFTKYPAGKYTPRSGKNVIMLVSHQSDLSGAPISLVILANHLKAKGYYPLLVLPKHGPLENKINDSVKVLNLHSHFKRWKLMNYVYKFRPALIHANTFLTEYALDVANKFGIKTIMHVREDLTLYPQIAKRLLQKAQRVILISHSMVRNFDTEPTRLDVIHNAVDCLPVSAELPLKPHSDPYNLLYIGSIEKRKGLWDLIQAVEIIHQQNKRVTLTALGKVLSSEKNYLHRIKSFCQKHKLDNVVNFVGATEIVTEYLDQASIVIVPSHSEPFGRVVIEAMARKKLVIATQVGGIPEIIEQYHNGFMVHPDNPGELAKMIMYVWEKSDEQKELVRERAYKTVVEKFMPDKYVDNVLEVYKRVIG